MTSHPSIDRHFKIWLDYVEACDARLDTKEATTLRKNLLSALQTSYKELEHLKIQGSFHAKVFHWHVEEMKRLGIHLEGGLPYGY